jgi:hypothetical protein
MSLEISAKLIKFIRSPNLDLVINDNERITKIAMSYFHAVEVGEGRYEGEDHKIVVETKIDRSEELTDAEAIECLEYLKMKRTWNLLMVKLSSSEISAEKRERILGRLDTMTPMLVEAEARVKANFDVNGLDVE